MHRHHVGREIAEVDHQPDAGGAGSAKVFGEYQKQRNADAERKQA